jgi:hypothetical protein
MDAASAAQREWSLPRLAPKANGGRCCHQPPFFLRPELPGQLWLSDRFRPRPFGLGRFRRVSASPGGFAVPLCGSLSPEGVSGSAAIPWPEGLGVRVGLTLESGFGSFRLSPSRASRFFLRSSCRPLCRCFFRSCELQKPLRRGGSGWLLSIRFRFAALPATQASWQPQLSRTTEISLWISRITGISLGARRKPSRGHTVAARQP